MRNTAAGIQSEIAKGVFRPHTALTNMALAYYQNAANYFAKALFPTCPVTSPHNSVTDISLSIKVFFTSLHHGDSFRFKISPPFSTNVYYICCLHLFAIALK